MKNFTDLLDDYLEAEKELKECRESFNGHDFGYFYAIEIGRRNDAADALNKAFEAATKGEQQ